MSLLHLNLIRCSDRAESFFFIVAFATYNAMILSCKAAPDEKQGPIIAVISQRTLRLGKPRKRTVQTRISFTKSRCPASMRCLTLSITCILRIWTALACTPRGSMSNSMANRLGFASRLVSEAACNTDDLHCQAFITGNASLNGHFSKA